MHYYRLLLFLADHGDGYLARLDLQGAPPVGQVVDGFIVQPDDHVTSLQASRISGTALFHRAHHNACPCRHVEEVRQLRTQALHHQTVARCKGGEGWDLDIRNNPGSHYRTSPPRSPGYEALRVRRDLRPASQSHFDVFLLTTAHHGEHHCLAGRCHVDHVPQLFGGFDLRTVKTNDDVILFQSRPACRAILVEIGNDRAVGIG